MLDERRRVVEEGEVFSARHDDEPRALRQLGHRRLRHGEVARVATLIYLVPPLTALEAFVLFGESLDAVQIGGMAVTAAGVWLATRRSRPAVGKP